jgi:hypothetical protein
MEDALPAAADRAARTPRGVKMLFGECGSAQALQGRRGDVPVGVDNAARSPIPVERASPTPPGKRHVD